MKDTDLKHITLKTAFLLALAPASAAVKFMPGLQQSIKFRPMGKDNFVPLFRFHSQNQLAREGSQSVSLETIKALTTIIDTQFTIQTGPCVRYGP